MAIAKYRKDGFPKEWFLTDFTMAQVEGRLEDLESENAKLKDALRGLEQASSKLAEWASGQENGVPVLIGTPALDAIRKAREVLGDA